MLFVVYVSDMFKYMIVMNVLDMWSVLCVPMGSKIAISCTYSAYGQ